jgi:arsenate reductase
MPKKKVLFLCTGNAARSQMAEGLVNARLAERWQAFSAGIRPAGFVHPRVIQVLQEAGIHHTGRSKSVDEMKNIDFDLVVTLCDSAKEECPVWLGAGRRVHHDYPDPGAQEGTDEQKLKAFRKLRDDMLSELPYILEKNDPGKMDL